MAAKTLGMNGTTAKVISLSTSYPKGCQGGNENTPLYFNNATSSSGNCGYSKHHDIYTCICREHSYRLVSSGRNCSWIRSPEECEVAAKALGMSSTTAKVISLSTSYPKGCQGGNENIPLYFNNATSSSGNCGLHNGKHTCICRDHYNL